MWIPFTEDSVLFSQWPGVRITGRWKVLCAVKLSYPPCRHGAFAVVIHSWQNPFTLWQATVPWWMVSAPDDAPPLLPLHAPPTLAAPGAHIATSTHWLRRQAVPQKEEDTPFFLFLFFHFYFPPLYLHHEFDAWHENTLMKNGRREICGRSLFHGVMARPRNMNMNQLE